MSRPLTSVSRKSLDAVFKHVGRWCTELGAGRTHIEWGWQADGGFWVFQLDFEMDQPDDGEDPEQLLRGTDERPPGAPPLDSPLKVATLTTRSGWPKVDKVGAFLPHRAAPYPRLHTITGAALRKALDAGYDLAADVDQITHGRGVCRTECVTPGIDRLNLPRTDSVSALRAVEFLSKALADLEGRGAAPDQVCFILHKFIPARAAAWALARPDQQIVQVDALWGLPDGLQYLPHDTFEYDVRRNAISAERIRFKPAFLQETPDGTWQRIKVARALTRRRSIGTAHLREIAGLTYAIAQNRNKSTQIMWFCDVTEEANVGRNVPWFMQDPEDSPATIRWRIAPDQKRVVVRTIADLERAREHVNGQVVLQVEPEVELYRDNDFLEQVADVARSKNFAVIMTGSILRHAFYTLERHGVTVIPLELASRARVRQRRVFNKLVRDFVPERIKEHGERVTLARITKGEARTALVAKLFEEGQELLAARSPQEVTLELADLLEILLSLSSITGVEWASVQEAAEEKRAARGGFEQNVVLLDTSWPALSKAPPMGGDRIISLKELGQIVSSKEATTLTFPAVLAKGADNVITMARGHRIAVSITNQGVELRECESDSSEGKQIQLPFERLD